MSQFPIPLVDIHDGAWQPHPRFETVFYKPLLTSSENPFANVNVVLLLPGGKIGDHIHHSQIETIFMVSGKGIFSVQGFETSFTAGQIIAVPSGAEHWLFNPGPDPIELVTIFTPPQ